MSRHIKLYISEKDQDILNELKLVLERERKSVSEFFIEAVMEKLGIETPAVKIKRLEAKIKELENVQIKDTSAE